ncbi:unnamed protein product [Parnassius apollo]|nr:unnamed protein product [Parnassius apollo]
MFCGKAAEETVPPCIVYKSDNLWSTWTENGPEGARYNRTKSGWMYSATFEDWFLNNLMPVLKKKNGKKVVIGDNLASHINKTVLNEREKHNYRAEACPEQKTIRKKKLNVPPGKSICATDLAEAGPSGLQHAKTIKEKKRATKRRQLNVSSSSSCSDRTISLASSTEDHIMPYDSEDDVLLANYVSQISDTDAAAFRHSPDLQQESEVEEEYGSPVLQVTDPLRIYRSLKKNVVKERKCR